MLSTKTLWGCWLVVAAVLTGYFGQQLRPDQEKPDFLIGETSHGHYQIEMECSTCHETAFGGEETLQQACVGCHAEELEIAQDSHPKSKFTDPRNADRLAQLDARYCVTCHQEHVEERTQLMAVSLPTDLCFHCHADIAEDRVSHSKLPFETCASSGCHNYHDNRALYEDFLVANSGGHWLNSDAAVPPSNLRELLLYLEKVPGERVRATAAAELQQHPEYLAIQSKWSESSHATGNVDCASCHQTESGTTINPGIESCSGCHDAQVDSFTSSKHGMRLAQDLSPMTPGLSRQNHSLLSFRGDSLDKPLNCATCHDVHKPDIQLAAVESCLTCHNDEHSESYPDSPHGASWDRFLAGEIPQEAAVSCATCHLPREESNHFGRTFVLANHNQNDTLRPNEKMIRPVCMNCHNLEFSIDALADVELIRRNFNGEPAVHIESIDMSLFRQSRPR